MGIFSDFAAVLSTSAALTGVTPQGVPVLTMTTKPPSQLQLDMAEANNAARQIAAVYLGLQQPAAANGGSFQSSVLLGVNAIDLAGKAAGLSGTFSNAGNMGGLVFGVLSNINDKAVAREAIAYTFPHYTVYDITSSTTPITDQQLADLTAERFSTLYQHFSTKYQCTHYKDKKTGLAFSGGYSGFSALQFSCNDNKIVVLLTMSANFPEESPWHALDKAGNNKHLVKQVHFSAVPDYEKEVYDFASSLRTPESFVHEKLAANNFVTIHKGNQSLNIDLPKK